MLKNMTEKVTIKPCKMCGHGYTVPQGQRFSLYCSRECAQEAIIASRKKYQKKYAPRKRIWERKRRAEKRRIAKSGLRICFDPPFTIYAGECLHINWQTGEVFVNDKKILTKIVYA
jgi:hypothetical protein